MNARVLIIAVALLGLFGLAGCYGPAPALNPTVTFKFADDTTLPYLESGGLLVITGEASVEDSGTNPITEYHWSQTPEAGVITAPNAASTTWAAPTLQPGDDPLPVVLSLTVKTLQGGSTTQTLNLIVQPPAGP